MTLRRRVFAYVVTAAVVSCALTVGAAVVLVRREVARQRLTALERQADLVSAVGGIPGALRPGEHVYWVAGRRPRHIARPRALLIIDRIPNLSQGQGQVTAAGTTLLYVARSTPSGGVVLVRPAGLAFAEWRPFLWSLLVAGAGGALIAAIASWLLARRLTVPIGQLAVATGRVTAGERDVVVPVTGDDELAELGRSFNHMAAELNTARQAQRHFLESVSHELKTPLTSIRGYAEALGDGAIDQHQAAAVIGDEAGRLERLVNDLLDLARLQRAGFTIAPMELDLVEVASQVVRRYRPRATSLGISLEASGVAPALAFADPDRLVQALSNLVENALRVTPSNGSVSVHADPGSLSVRDTGPGIAADDLPRAFERFYLFERYRSERPVGSGLGLTIVSELAQQMGGTVRVESAVQAGTQFTITLPLGGPGTSRIAGGTDPP